jgi:AraC family transcriptional regulator
MTSYVKFRESNPNAPQTVDGFVLLTTVAETSVLRVMRYRCTAGPEDEPFGEAHAADSLSYVRAGVFGYHPRGRSYQMSAGSILIGRNDDEFSCSHEDGCGDECLSFQFSNGFIEELVRAGAWRSIALPPLPRLVGLGELAVAAIDGTRDVDLHEIGIVMASHAAGVFGEPANRSRRLSAVNRRRIVLAAQWIEDHAFETIALADAASVAGLSEFHFLRQFVNLFEVSPHQFLIRCRLRNAIRLLLATTLAVSQIAYDVGFPDLSNFARTFKMATGVSARDFRKITRERRLDVHASLLLPARPN